MMGEFLNRNNNTDALIILIIGMIIPIASKFIYHTIKKLTHRIIHYTIGRYKNHKRIKRGDYNMGEIKQIQKKPENERTEKEKLALHKWNAITAEINKSISKQADAMQVLNEKLSNKF